MSETNDTAPLEPDDTEPRSPEDDPPPDESTMMGVSGVETEVLAEAARAEAELSNPDAPPPDDEGATV